MKLDLKDLRAKAEVANQEDWQVSKHGVVHTENARICMADGYTTDSVFIAAANPQVVLALIDRIERLEAALVRGDSGFEALQLFAENEGRGET